MNSQSTVLTCLIALLLTIAACQTAPASGSPCSGEPSLDSSGIIFPVLADEPVADYVVALLEDQEGRIWMGTVGKGVARWDGKKLVYFNMAAGLPDNTVSCIVQGPDGRIWLGTHNGLVLFEEGNMKVFGRNEGLCDQRVSCLLFDDKGELWVGTWGGICKWNGQRFEDFALPVPEFEIESYLSTMNWVTEMVKDKEGNIWIGRDGYGITRYDGKGFRVFGKPDGLLSNNVQSIAVDGEGRIWVGARIAERDHPDQEKRTGLGGLCSWQGKAFRKFEGMPGLDSLDVYALHTDLDGQIWFGANGIGMGKIGKDGFELFKGSDRMDLTAALGVQDILKDRRGQIWLGMSGGLFRLEEDKIKHFAKP